jgi:hypothetical protein
MCLWVTTHFGEGESMNLKEVLREIADEAVEEAEHCEECCQREALHYIAGKLRGIASVLPDEQPQQIPSHSMFGPMPVGSVGSLGTHKEMSQFTHHAMMAKAQEDAREQRQNAIREENQPRMAFCVDGPEQGTCFPLDSEMPQKAFTRICGHVYQLDGNKLRYYQPTTTPVIE